MQDIEVFSSYGLGHLARRKGIAKEANPFSKTGEWHSKWNTGWDHADEELPPLATPKPKASLRVIPLREIK